MMEKCDGFFLKLRNEVYVKSNGTKGNLSTLMVGPNKVKW